MTGRVPAIVAHIVLFGTMLISTATIAQNNVPRDIRRNYPDERYIVRLGSGETAESAAEGARLEIAKYFESKISGETVVHEWASSQSTRGKVTEERFTELTNTIMISATRDIPGIEIAQNERDGRNGDFQAWAVLERSAYARLLQERIAQTDQNIRLRMDQDSHGDLNQLRVLGQNLTDLLAREQDRQDLALLDTDTVIPNDQTMLFMIMSQLDSLIAEAFDVAVVFEGEIDTKVKNGLIQGITDTGIRIRQFPDISTASEADIDLIISVEHTVTPRVTSQTVNGREFTFYFSNWVLSIGTMDPDTSEILSSTVLNDETNGSYESQAAERMINKILSNQVPVISSWVYNTIFKPQG